MVRGPLRNKLEDSTLPAAICHLSVFSASVEKQQLLAIVWGSHCDTGDDKKCLNSRSLEIMESHRNKGMEFLYVITFKVIHCKDERIQAGNLSE